MQESGLPSFWEENLKVLEGINRGLVNELLAAQRGPVSFEVEPTGASRYLCRSVHSESLTELLISRPLTSDADSGGLCEWIHPPAGHPERVSRISDRDLARNDLFIVLRMGLGNEVLDLYERLATVEMLREGNRR
ncbi:MAG: hypothetical protein ABIH23_01105, partial [bacterium]